MDATADGVKSALPLIEDVGLPYPSGPLLASFVTEAKNPAAAARYVAAQLAHGEGSSLVSNWSHIIDSNAVAQQDIVRRDGNRCCITGKPGTFRDPLVVAPILPVPSGWVTDKDGINDMLGAFFGPPYRDWCLSYAFAHGLVRLDRLQHSMVEYKIRHVLIKPEAPIELDSSFSLLGDHSRQGIEKVDARFIGSHARLSGAIQFLDISRTLSHAPMSPIATRTQHLSTVLLKPFTALCRLFSRVLLAGWRAVPSSVRHFYGQEPLAAAYRAESDELRNEFNALRTVRQHTSIPTPSALDVAVAPRDQSGSSSSAAYLLSTIVPGLPLSRCLHVLSDNDCDQITAQLREYLAQLRNMPIPSSPGNAISNTLGEACREPRVGGARPIGLFPDESSFNQVLRFSNDPAPQGHRILFTHADLNPRNILVDQVTRTDGSTGWSVTGIVDWESPGHYPEYWKYTKAMFEGFRWPRRYNNLIRAVFWGLGDYSREFEVERRSWESGDVV
ncbi:hypothetical protein B0T26DRAFT_736119 [Lasiosphaeria miniovina]|uniref:Aminoglycoside phosphotransferase domain-containing protein n=1 Tax=Lasiosphaeria miniovina TaxID=1954250 RepID=A0AA40BF00_9PEZI|nr:uncharacterized protein B0T26DRAFT_736119 [Lasiosphaeria miniovina]KAK0733034.1 hypothetical protein B0T26DRAFT_736119 [Lasiosphaeria miniovina]